MEEAAIPDDVRRFVDAQRIARLATVDEAGRPHVVPVCFALVGDHLYTAIDEKPKRGDVRNLRRLRNIAAQPDVQVLFDVYDDDWSRLRYVQVRGRARIVEPASQQHAVAVAALRARYIQYREMGLESLPVIAVEIERAVGWAGEK
jgi:PPOX class probable F420-dependent enzyme